MQIAGRVRSFRRPRLAAPAGGLRAAGKKVSRPPSRAARPAAEEPAADVGADGEARKRRGLRELDAAPTARAGPPLPSNDAAFSIMTGRGRSIKKIWSPLWGGGA